MNLNLIHRPAFFVRLIVFSQPLVALKGRGGPFQRRRRSALASGGTIRKCHYIKSQLLMLRGIPC